MEENNNTESRAAKHILIKESTMALILRLEPKDCFEVLKALYNYFSSNYCYIPKLNNPVTEIVFSAIKDELDTNERHCIKKIEGNRKGGQETQKRRREAIQKASDFKQPAPDCTIRNIIKFLVEEEGLTEQDATIAANDFVDYNNTIDNIERTKTGELKLLSDQKGRPLFDWRKAVIGFLNSGYGREEWERNNNIDPKTHRPRK